MLTGSDTCFNSRTASCLSGSYAAVTAQVCVMKAANALFRQMLVPMWGNNEQRRPDGHFITVKQRINMKQTR